MAQISGKDIMTGRNIVLLDVDICMFPITAYFTWSDVRLELGGFRYFGGFENNCGSNKSFYIFSLILSFLAQYNLTYRKNIFECILYFFYAVDSNKIVVSYLISNLSQKIINSYKKKGYSRLIQIYKKYIYS